MQEYWSGLSFPSPGDLPNTGIEPRSPALQVDSLLSEPPGKSHFACSYGNHSFSTYSLTLVFWVLGGESTLS